MLSIYKSALRDASTYTARAHNYVGARRLDPTTVPGRSDVAGPQVAWHGTDAMQDGDTLKRNPSILLPRINLAVCER